MNIAARWLNSGDADFYYKGEELCKMQEEKTGESRSRKIGFYAD